MGMCLEEFGRISIEVRRESFTIHPSYGFIKCKPDEEGDEMYNPNPSPFEKEWLDTPHPEFLLEDLDDLIKALEDARDYLKRGRRVR